MKKKRHLPRRPGKHSALRGLLAVLAACALLAALIDWQIRPVIESMAAYQVKVFAFKIVNDAVMEELSGDKADYADFIELSRRGDGEVTSIRTDMMAINLLKARMSRRIAAELEKKDNHSLFVPVGTLLGNQLTSGRGPLMEIKILPTGYVQSEITHRFTSAGINQTLHQLMLNTNIHITAIIPGYSVRTETSTNFCIAETIIVGQIPDSFAQLELGNAPVFSKIGNQE